MILPRHTAHDVEEAVGTNEAVTKLIHRRNPCKRERSDRRLPR